MHRTAFAGLTALDENDQITVDGGSFLTRNMDVIDRLLQVGCVTHHHDAHPGLPNPVATLSASVSITGGQIEAGTSVYMGYTFTDAQGGETALSPAVVANTQGPIVPDLPPPTASADYTAGSLPIGGYSYAFSYSDAAGGQTELQPAVFVTREAGPASGQVILSGLSAGLVSGLVSWKAWRADEGGDYNLLAEGASDSFTDTGFTCTDCTATPPSVNTTNHTSEISIQLPASGVDAGVLTATGINVYLSVDGSFATPALYAAFPVASAGATFPVTELVLGAGSPPPVNRTLQGAGKIDPDTEISGPWKKAVASASLLPATGNTEGDVRETLLDHRIHAWTSASGGVWVDTGGHSSIETHDFVFRGPIAIAPEPIPGHGIVLDAGQQLELIGVLHSVASAASGSMSFHLQNKGVDIPGFGTAGAPIVATDTLTYTKPVTPVALATLDDIAPVLDALGGEPEGGKVTLVIRETFS